MKEAYNKPEVKVDEFQTVDVLTTSGGTNPDDPIVTPPDWGD